MSGAEAVAIVGLIASVVTIIETSRHLFDAASSASGLHEAFRAVAQNIPLVLNILRDCKRVQEAVDRQYNASTNQEEKRKLYDSAEVVRPIMERCRENAQDLKEIFEKVVPGDQASWLERYKKAAHAVMPNTKHKVEDLMKEILEKLQLLHTNQYFRSETEKRSSDLETAIAQLSDLPSSLPEDDGRYSHSGSGSMNVNAGDGTQHNYNQSGGSNNKQFNAHTQSFGTA